MIEFSIMGGASRPMLEVANLDSLFIGGVGPLYREFGERIR